MHWLPLVLLLNLPPLTEYQQGILFMAEVRGWTPASNTDSQTLFFLTGQIRVPDHYPPPDLTANEK